MRVEARPVSYHPVSKSKYASPGKQWIGTLLLARNQHFSYSSDWFLNIWHNFDDIFKKVPLDKPIREELAYICFSCAYVFSLLCDSLRCWSWVRSPTFEEIVIFKPSRVRCAVRVRFERETIRN